jgi:hypothetical protein
MVFWGESVGRVVAGVVVLEEFRGVGGRDDGDVLAIIFSTQIILTSRSQQGDRWPYP